MSTSGDHAEPVIATDPDDGTQTAQANRTTSSSAGTPAHQGGTTVPVDNTHPLAEADPSEQVTTDDDTVTIPAGASGSGNGGSLAGASFNAAIQPGPTQTETVSGTEDPAGKAVAQSAKNGRSISTSAAPSEGPSIRADDRPWITRELEYRWSQITGFFTRPSASPLSRIVHHLVKPVASGVADGVSDVYNLVTTNPATTLKNAAGGLYVVLSNPRSAANAVYMSFEEFRSLTPDEKNDLTYRFAGRVAFDVLTASALAKVKSVAKLKLLTRAELGTAGAEGIASEGAAASRVGETAQAGKQAAEEAVQQAGKETAQQAAKEIAEETGEQAAKATTPLAGENRVVGVHGSTAGRPFRELIQDAAANPSKWKVVKTESLPSSNMRNKGGTSL